ncbi:PASTA domain-containing protein [Streptomyces sp. BR123]|uniref:PASTA domain-containing protein n=1 Tax=Streptomyces sp. BR123 TaxID=2749828 RepID=UPI0015C48BA0|nr:PASTA domain-containing protein [Streptomyces sp. BR123]NXY95559.1 PASTA domain-containing protein [Streptomyces sp. BR123]
MPGPQADRIPPTAPTAPQGPGRTAWWRTDSGRFALVAAVPAAGLLEPRLGAAALIAALVAVWRGGAWPTAGKLAASVVAAALLGGVLPELPDGAAAQAPSPRAGSRKAAVPTVASSPTPTVPPLADFRGQSLETAFNQARQTGFLVRNHDASEKDGFVRGLSRWTVCFQQTGWDGRKPTAEFGAVPNGAPCPARDGEPVPWPKMPDLVWKTWQTARAEVVALGVRPDRIRARAAYLNDTLPDEGEYEDWRVCRQDPAAGTAVKPDTPLVELRLAAEENGCPEQDRGTGTDARLPDRDGDGDPDYRDPFPGDRSRTRAFPDGIPDYSGSSGGSPGGSSGGSGGSRWSPCRHTRLC